MSDEPTGKASAQQFFDALTDQYAAAIERCFPRYREMLWALLDYLPQQPPVNDVLELGAGTGNLTVLLAEKYPHATITAVDISGESLEVCRSRLGRDSRFKFSQADFRDLRFEPDQFELVTSSIAVHHLRGPEKQTLMGRIYDWLRSDGTFAYVDQHAGATDELSQRHLHHWKQLSMSAGSTEQEWQMWMQHQADHDHHDTTFEQIHWLREAGFERIDCPWRYLLWTVLQARKKR